MKRLLWIAAVAPLLGIAFFYIYTSPSVPSPLPKASSNIPKPPATSPSKAQRDAEASRLHAELVKRDDESMARLAKTLTPRLQEQMLNVLMADRVPRYQALFDSWNLEPGRGDEALKIVRAREKAKYEALRMRGESGMAGGRVFNETLEFEKEFSDTQLRALFGDKHFEEFSRLESQIESQMQAAGMSMIRD